MQSHHKRLNLFQDEEIEDGQELHEFSAACSIVDAAVAAAEKHGATRVTAVNVEIGQFTFLVPEQLEFNFEIAIKKTIIEDAKLVISMIPGMIKCHDCGHEGEAQTTPGISSQIAMFAPMQCSKCEGSNTEITGGKEFIISNIEAEIAE